jgi:hypothetical protein
MSSDFHYIKKGLTLYGRRAYDASVSKGEAVILKGNTIYSVTSEGEKILHADLPQTEVAVKKYSYSLRKKEK